MQNVDKEGQLERQMLNSSPSSCKSKHCWLTSNPVTLAKDRYAGVAQQEQAAECVEMGYLGLEDSSMKDEPVQSTSISTTTRSKGKTSTAPSKCPDLFNFNG